MVKRLINITDEMNEWLKKVAESQGLTVTALINVLLSEYKQDDKFNPQK